MKKYYDITTEGTSLVWFFYIGLAVLIITVIWWFYLMVKGRPLGEKLRVGFFIGISFIWTMIVWISSMSHYLDAKEALETGAVGEVSGIVTDFSPIPPGDHGDESFTVNGIHFKFSPSKMDFGFDQTVSQGGPAFEGRYVKIQYFEGRILRLWAKDE